jgi:nicotinate-nucleotide adenylyltransferase
VTGVLGGVFDPPHAGHVALAQAAVERFSLDRLVVLVASHPAHKHVETPAWARLRLADAAFPGHEVELDDHPYTVDAVAGRRFHDAIFVVGADEFRDFLTWKDPDGVLERVRLGVATRPGYVKEQLIYVLERLSQPGRVTFFDAPPVPVASSNVRRRLAAGEPIDGLVPDAVAKMIGELGLYRPSATPG